LECFWRFSSLGNGIGFRDGFWFWFLVKNDRFSFDLEEIEIVGKVRPLDMRIKEHYSKLHEQDLAWQ